MSGEHPKLRRALLASTALALAAVQPALAQDATWLNAPGSGDFGNGANWSTGTVPTGTAFFDTSNTTALSTSGFITTVGGWTFNASAANYNFSNLSNIIFTGAGIDI